MGISGKSDFEDYVCMHNTPQEILDNYDIYPQSADGTHVLPLKFEKPEDFIPYYPYLTAMIWHDNETKRGKIILSRRSFIDAEETDHLESEMRWIKRYYRKCKRKKVEFNKDKVLEKIAFFGVNSPEQIEIVNRVAEKGNKATIEDIHDETHDHMRKKLYDLMVSNGWNEDISYKWVFGINRWMEKLKAEKAEKINDNNSEK